MFDINKCYHCFATEPNSAYFWSGLGENGQDIAAQVAQDNGGTTLEMLMDRNKDELISAGFPYDEDLGGFYFSKENAQDWQAISQAYAEQASGDVHVVLGENVREDSVWNTKELPALEKNDNVDKVVSVDPKTGNEKDVLLDKKSSESTSNDDGKNSTNRDGTENHLSVEKSNERGTKPSHEENPSSNKDESSERGQKPSSAEVESQNKDVERGQKPDKSESDIKDNNQQHRGEKLQEPLQKDEENTQQTNRGTTPSATNDEPSGGTDESSDNKTADNQPSADGKAKSNETPQDIPKKDGPNSGMNM